MVLCKIMIKAMKKEIIKPFDLEAYKNGAKIQTRNGRKVRIICTDVENPCFTIIGLVKLKDGNELNQSYTSKGKVHVAESAISDNDLVIVEEVEEPEFWTDKENKTADGYFIDSDSSIAYCPYVYYNRDYYKTFADRKQAISAEAMARISQIMANDIDNFGGVVTDEEWKERAVRKYCIYRTNNNMRTVYAYSDYYFLAFHTPEQCDLFLKKYERLVKDYLCLD